MAANIDPMFYATLYNAQVSFAAQAACTTRAPTATAGLAAANIIAFVPTTGNTNGRRIDTIRAKACATAINGAGAATNVIIWRHDGTTAWPIKEIELPAVTPGTTTKSMEIEEAVDIRLAPGESLYASTTVTTLAASSGFCLIAEGGNY